VGKEGVVADGEPALSKCRLSAGALSIVSARASWFANAELAADDSEGGVARDGSEGALAVGSTAAGLRSRTTTTAEPNEAAARKITAARARARERDGETPGISRDSEC